MASLGFEFCTTLDPDDFYATLLQLGLEPVTPKTIARKTQTETKTHEKSTQTEKTGVFWGYF